MKTVKRLLCLLLALALLPCIPAYAEEAEYAGLIEYWQFNDIAGAPAYDVKIYMGDLMFSGLVSRENCLTQEEIDRCISEALSARGMTKDDLAAIVTKLELAKKAPEEDWRAVISVLESLAGVDTLVDLVKYITDSSGVTDRRPTLEEVNHSIASMAAGNIAGKSVTKLLLKTGSRTVGFGVSLAINAGSMGLEALIDEIRDKEGMYWTDIEVAHLQLANLYRDIDSKITLADEAKGGRWRIKVNDSVTQNDVTCFGAGGNSIRWHLNLDLVRNGESLRDALGYGGTYTGTVNLVADADLTGTQDALMCLFVKTPYYDTISSVLTMYGMTSGPAYMKLSALQGEITMDVGENGSMQSVPFTPELSSYGDIAHDLYLCYTGEGYDSRGHLNYDGVHAWVYSSANFTLTGNEYGAEIGMAAIDGKAGVVGYGANYSYPWGFPSVILVTDPNVFKEARSPMYLYIVGGEWQ